MAGIANVEEIEHREDALCQSARIRNCLFWNAGFADAESKTRPAGSFCTRTFAHVCWRDYAPDRGHNREGRTDRRQKSRVDEPTRRHSVHAGIDFKPVGTRCVGYLGDLRPLRQHRDPWGRRRSRTSQVQLKRLDDMRCHQIFPPSAKAILD
jgi:hypothetical protein